MDDNLHTHPDVITAATQLVKTGRLDQARDLLIHFIAQNPNSEQAWLLMSYVISDPAKQKDCLERVLTINPANSVAKSKLALTIRKIEELSAKEKKEPVPAAISAAAPIPEVRSVPPPAAAAAPIAPLVKPRLIPPKPMDAPLTIAEIRGAASGSSNSILSSRWIRIGAVGLAALVLIILAVLAIVGLVVPAVSKRAPSPSPTPETIYVMTLPAAWTQTLTPTPTFTLTFTLTDTPTLPTTPTISKTK